MLPPSSDICDGGVPSLSISVVAAASSFSAMRLGSKNPFSSLAISSDLAGDDGEVPVDDASHSHGVLLNKRAMALGTRE